MLASSMSGTILSLLMLAGAMLLVGGVHLVRKGGADRRRGWLMLIAAIVMFGNVAIWVAPL